MAELELICSANPHTYFVIDESYLMFVDGSDRQSMMRSTLPNIMVLNSLSKFFTIPGLRIGFLISSPVNIKKFKAYLLPWSVNSLAQMAVQYLMEQTAQVEEFIKNTITFIAREKDILYETFKISSNIKIFPSTTSFILARLYGNLTADVLGNHLAQDRILIRNCSNFYGLSDRFVRFSLKTSEINRIFMKNFDKKRVSCLLGEYSGYQFGIGFGIGVTKNGAAVNENEVSLAIESEPKSAGFSFGSAEMEVTGIREDPALDWEKYIRMQ